MRQLWLIFGWFFAVFHLHGMQVGADRLFHKEELSLLKGKKIGIVTNHTAILSDGQTTLNRLMEEKSLKVVAIFAPEHGLDGVEYASKDVEHTIYQGKIPVYSLHAGHRRPTEKMLSGIDILIYDIQDVGVRSYTYTTTLFYVMEECRKYHVALWVLDRPNPMGGMVVDGPMLDGDCRCFAGYINVPFCHGMTVGELSLFFNQEYQIGVQLKVVPMEGWKRLLHFEKTGLSWIPTSPNMPEPSTPFYFATTGLIGELGIVSIGVGYTLPFKIVGAPWIKGADLAQRLNQSGLAGVFFHPIAYKPFFGLFKMERCEGVKIEVTDVLRFRPMDTCYTILDLIKSMYPHQFKEAIDKQRKMRKDLFAQIAGSKTLFQLLSEPGSFRKAAKELHQREKSEFLIKRERYLLYA